MSSAPNMRRGGDPASCHLPIGTSRKASPTAARRNYGRGCRRSAGPNRRRGDAGVHKTRANHRRDARAHKLLHVIVAQGAQAARRGDGRTARAWLLEGSEECKGEMPRVLIVRNKIEWLISAPDRG